MISGRSGASRRAARASSSISAAPRRFLDAAAGCLDSSALPPSSNTIQRDTRSRQGRGVLQRLPCAAGAPARGSASRRIRTPCFAGVKLGWMVWPMSIRLNTSGGRDRFSSRAYTASVVMPAVDCGLHRAAKGASCPRDGRRQQTGRGARPATVAVHDDRDRSGRRGTEISMSAAVLTLGEEVSYTSMISASLCLSRSSSFFT